MKGLFMTGIIFVVIGLSFFCFLPALIAIVCESDKKIVLSSILVACFESVSFVPSSMANITGIDVPHFYIKFFGADIVIWLFFINLLIVFLHNRKKLFK